MNEAVAKLKKLNAKRIFVHFPEGLKMRIQDISKQLEKEGFEVVLCMEATWGACDVREYEAGLLKCDAILHVAHEDYGVKTKMPVVYWEYFFDADPIPILEKDFDKIKNFKRIGLVTSLQFVKTLPAVKDFLEKNGKEVFLHKTQDQRSNDHPHRATVTWPGGAVEQFGQASRPISTAWLKGLHPLHLPPINLVVYEGS